MPQSESVKKEELVRRIQAHRRFLDDLLVDIVRIQEAVPMPPVETPRQEAEQDRLMRAKEIQEFLGIKPATFYDWIKKGILPAGENFGGCTRTRLWRLSAISASLGGRRGVAK
ncbi:MAG: helix-turn-helix domain-containing protein [Synergistaceae bacterium]|jgi:predicted DNA-binding transcriptional regulator AlpA|nr:helix-turn-helix domain-containing protein [Synergistaceae bacterium]